MQQQQESDTTENGSSSSRAKDRRTFAFKNFSVTDENCGMKVGTDGVLLGLFPTMVLERKIAREHHRPHLQQQSQMMTSPSPLTTSHHAGTTRPVPTRKTRSGGSTSMHLRVLDIGCGSGLVALVFLQELISIWEWKKTDICTRLGTVAQPSTSPADVKDLAHQGVPDDPDNDQSLQISIALVDVDQGACQDAHSNLERCFTSSTSTTTNDQPVAGVGHNSSINWGKYVRSYKVFCGDIREPPLEKEISDWITHGRSESCDVHDSSSSSSLLDKSEGTEGFDYILSNPPYFEPSGVIPEEKLLKNRSKKKSSSNANLTRTKECQVTPQGLQQQPQEEEACGENRDERGKPTAVNQDAHSTAGTATSSSENLNPQLPMTFQRERARMLSSLDQAALVTCLEKYLLASAEVTENSEEEENRCPVVATLPPRGAYVIYPTQKGIMENFKAAVVKSSRLLVVGAECLVSHSPEKDPSRSLVFVSKTKDKHTDSSVSSTSSRKKIGDDEEEDLPLAAAFTQISWRLNLHDRKEQREYGTEYAKFAFSVYPWVKKN